MTLDANVPAMHNDELLQHPYCRWLAFLSRSSSAAGALQDRGGDQSSARDLRRNEAAPFVLRENRVMAFKTCGARRNRFLPVVARRVERHSVSDWVMDPDKERSAR